MSAGADRAPRVNYDEIAGGYDERYESNPLPAVGEALVRLATGVGARRVLEVGCGTGHWLETLSRAEAPLQIVGLDPSAGMLGQARQRPVALTLVQGRAEALPFAAGTLDLIYAVNAFHHFTDKARFLAAARRALRPGARLAVVAFDPRVHPDWPVYRYFEGTYEIDLQRMPSRVQMRSLMATAGFERVEQREVTEERTVRRGREILDDPFLQKQGTSELALISDAAYEAGIRRIKETIERAEDVGQTATFSTDIVFYMTLGAAP
ncbi:MAG TPA: class I SAM-dependent methyltransferase [Candidatus Sulfomarinibacteraceae bacterium]|nr:class I SAM-dependent methyltransferase [Candidatus Sulfomarinibacteraceae bacterium]